MTKAWNQEREDALVAGLDKGSVITQSDVAAKAEELETTTRSIGAKLRKMGFDVQKASEARTSSWTAEEEDHLRTFLVEQSGTYTYAQLAGLLFDGKYEAKSIQGKILSMELTANVRPADKVEAVKVYTEAEEETFINMAMAGSSVEAIAESLGKTIKSVRGKALSLSRSVDGFVMPVQETSFAKVQVDPWDSVDVSTLTVAEISEQLDKSERGVKTALTRRGLTCKDYDGATKKQKIQSKAEAAA